MIYKIEFTNGSEEYCTAKDIVDLLKSYDDEIGLNIQELDRIIEISDDEANQILIKNTDWQEGTDEPENWALSELAFSDEFQIIASTEYE